MTAEQLPVRSIEPDASDLREPAAGIALCLSGGGYRSMLFHVGALKCINDAGYLRALNRISSVSGGSITAGVLGMHWKQLGFRNGVATNFDENVVAPIRKLAGMTLDICSVAWGVILPGSINDQLAAAYRTHLFGKRTLQDLPRESEGEAPRFIFNATNVQTGVLMRFSRPYLADYLVGSVRDPRIELAVAVAASSAYPPFLSPTHIDMSKAIWVTERGNKLTKPDYRNTAILTDGGVYDNLGLETAWKRYRTILVSDGGGCIAPENAPYTDWPRHSKRVVDLIDNQVRSLRKRQLIGSYKLPADHPYHRDGTYWGIRSSIADYDLQHPAGDPFTENECAGKTVDLAEIPTRLSALPDIIQKRLINWGYAVCNVALRRWVNPAIKASGFPFAKVGVG